MLPLQRYFFKDLSARKPLAEYSVGRGKYTFPLLSLALTASDYHLFKQPPLNFLVKRWNINEVILTSDLNRCCYADPALQEDHNKILAMIRNDEFVVLTSAKASRKTTRMSRLMSQLNRGYLCFLYVTMYEHVASLLIFFFGILSL
jgi:hypothetical protein